MIHEPTAEALDLDPREEVCPDCHLVRWRATRACLCDG